MLPLELDKFNLNNLFSLYQDIAYSYPGTSVFDFEGFQVVKTADSVWPNIAFNIEESEINEDMINLLDREMQNLGMHPFLISHYRPGSLDIFRLRRFSPVEQWQGMWLDELGKLIIPSIDEEVDLSVLDGTEIECWANLVSVTLFKSKYLDSRIFNSSTGKRIKLVGLKVKDELAGASMIYYDSMGTAGIYMVCVSEHFRGKGLGKMMVNFCIDQIRKDGKNTCFLQSTKSGVPLYESLNFKKLGRYFLYWKI